MKVECICGKWHEVTPTGLALVVYAYQEGLLHSMTPWGPEPVCMKVAFDDKKLVEMFTRRYPGNIVAISRESDSNARTTENEERTAQTVQQPPRQRKEGGGMAPRTGPETGQETGSEGSRGPKQAA